MSKDFSITPPQEATRSVNASMMQTSLTEASATLLMDELFQDLEHHLEHLAAEQNQSLSEDWPEQTATLDIAQSTPTATLITPEEDAFVPFSDLDPELDFLIPQDEPPQSERSLHLWPPGVPEPRFQRRLLFGAACTTLLVGTCLWVGNQINEAQITEAVVSAPQTAPESVSSPGDVAFAEYVLRSLNRIDQQSSLKQSPTANTSQPPTAAISPSAAVASLPGVPQINAGNSSSAGARTTTPNRVYVPKAQAPLPKPKLTAVAPPAPSTPSTPEYAATAAKKSQPLPLTSSAEASQNVLKGVLDLGNQSMALVESNGSTRRIQMGEPLNSSGLTLVEVQQGKAMVQKGGEVRSLSVGDRF